MNVVLFGGSGMVGQGVLRECLLDPRVFKVTSIVRSPSGQQHEKLHEIVQRDFTDFKPLAVHLVGATACFYCLGVTSLGLTEEQYRRTTVDITLAAAHVMHDVNPDMTFIFVSGKGTDSSEKGSVMWARVKGAAENAVIRMFEYGFAFRPGVIQPLHGVTSKTPSYRFFYAILGPVLTLLRGFTSLFTTTEKIGRAMINVAAQSYPRRILETEDINRAA